MECLLICEGLDGSPDLRHLPPVLHVREGIPWGIPPQLFGLSTGSWGLVAGVSQRYFWGMPSGTDGSSSEISVNQGRMGSPVVGDWCYIPGDLWWTIPGCPRDVSLHIALVHHWLARVKQVATVWEAAWMISANILRFFYCMVHRKNWGSCGYSRRWGFFQ